MYSSFWLRSHVVVGQITILMCKRPIFWTNRGLLCWEHERVTGYLGYLDASLLWMCMCMCECLCLFAGLSKCVCVCVTLTDSHAPPAQCVMPCETKAINTQSSSGHESLPAASSAELHPEPHRHAVRKLQFSTAGVLLVLHSRPPWLL